MDVLATWAPTLTVLVVVGIGVLARHWLVARIEKGIEHRFDTQLETLRADLREKEAEISALRHGVLSGRANRQALLDRRRLTAVENIWKAVIALAPLVSLSRFLSGFKYDAVAERAPTDPRLRQVFEMLGGDAAKKPPEVHAREEQPFLSELAWAYFSAYSTILFTAYGRWKMVEVGVEEPQKFFNEEAVRALLKTVLPHQAEYIDNGGPERYHYLLEELESKLLEELKRSLEGQEADSTEINRTAAIMEQVKRVTKDREASVSEKSAPPP